MISPSIDTACHSSKPSPRRDTVNMDGYCTEMHPMDLCPEHKQNHRSVAINEQVPSHHEFCFAENPYLWVSASNGQQLAMACTRPENTIRIASHFSCHVC